MELWIRSQDKTTLIKVTKLCFEWNIDNEPTIYGYEKYDNYERLGVYKTKERALEVLDEIQTYIEKKGTPEIFSQNGIPNVMKYYSRVYEMPKD